MSCSCCVQVSDRGVLVVELGSGLSFPATEYLSHIIHTQALQGLLIVRLCLEDHCSNVRWCLSSSTTSFRYDFTVIYPPVFLSSNLSPPACPPKSVVLDCHHVSVIDYTVISELSDLLRQFRLREVRLVFCRLEVMAFSLGPEVSQQNIRWSLCGFYLTPSVSVFIPPSALCSGGSPCSRSAGLQL